MPQRDGTSQTCPVCRESFDGTLRRCKDGWRRQRFCSAACYRAFRMKIGEKAVQSGEKPCKDCGLIKPLAHFQTNLLMIDGSTNQCRACRSIEQRRRRSDPSYRRRERIYARRTNLKAKYAMTEQEFERLFDEQGRRCAICRSDDSANGRIGINAMHVDHDHKTYTIRGILCAKCNRALGQFEDDIDRLKAAVLYLQTSRLRLVSADSPIWESA